MATEPAQVMVFTPHPDDAETAAAGTVARMVREGKDVVYVVCTNGDKGTSDINMLPSELAELREREQLTAAEILGVREVVFLRHPDQGLEDAPEFRNDVVRLIRQYRPQTVITVDLSRRYLWHRDHRITGRVVLDAVVTYAGSLYAYSEMIAEGLQPYQVKEVLLWGAPEPNYRSNITDTFDLKMRALFCHKSQVGDNISAEAMERRKERYRTLAEGEDFELAEAFYRLEFSTDDYPLLYH